MTTPTPIPLVIMAGSDPEPVQLPESGAGKHPLVGPKGLEVQVAGKPLIDRLIDRLRQIELFEPIYIAGPQRIYGASRHGVEVIDTDGSFGENARRAVEGVEARHPAAPIAMTVCDILPDVDELRSVLVDFREHRPLDFWFPLILAPASRRLGASAWKPQYRMVPRDGVPAVRVLPGHLILIDPRALRLEFIYRSFELAYRSRNRPLVYRFFFLFGHLLLHLAGQDLRQIRRRRIPGITLTVVYQAAVIVAKLRRGTMTNEELARRFRLIYVHSAHRRRHPDRLGRLPLVEALSLAKDLDTEEEADELARQLAAGEPEASP